MKALAFTLLAAFSAHTATATDAVPRLPTAPQITEWVEAPGSPKQGFTEGTATALLLIDEHGTVQKATWESGSPKLEKLLTPKLPREVKPYQHCTSHDINKKTIEECTPSAAYRPLRFFVFVPSKYLTPEYAFQVPQTAKEQEPLPYPILAQENGDEGTVHLSIFLGSDGKATPLNIKKSSGHPVLDRAAFKYASSLKFTPATLNGQKIGMVATQSIKFTLSDNANTPEPAAQTRR